MRLKLVTFSDFANQLYPHEADYLLSIQKFSKGVNMQILNTLHSNCHNPLKAREYDPSIDKRSYSYIKTWVTQALEKADVDKFYEWLAYTEKQVMIDAITPEEEKQILVYIKTTNPSQYFFLRFYELLQYFRDYLLIRVRNQFYKPINDFLQKYESAYRRSITINTQLNQAAEEIIRQHETLDADPIHYNDFLQATFNDSTLDGYTRYRAAVRLTFLYYNYREFENLRVLYDELDRLFKTNVFYSKRLLANYYSNRAMMHSKLNELALAEKFGYLSIRQKNSDYLFYLANLCGVLLRSGKYDKALKLMSSSIPELKKTNSFYNKIGFASFYTRTLVYNKMAKNAVSYATTFLDAYKKEIFATRWHLFFAAYLQALLSAEKYSRLLAVAKRYNLLALEKKFIDKTVYMPVLLWYNEVALYMEGKQSNEKLEENIMSSARLLLQNKYKAGRINELLDNLSDSIPSEILSIRNKLHELQEINI
ncbi:MAG: hypothetical protein WC780_18295 [Lentimicrobiaceae bacterium]|jgi:hypothetical protein